MKLVERNSEIRILKEEIVIDTNLPKYSRLYKEKENFHSGKKLSDDPDSEVSGLTETDYLSYLLGIDGEKEELLKGVSSISNLKELVREADSQKFNIRISDYLLKKVKDQRNSEFLRRAGGASNNAFIDQISLNSSSSTKGGILKKFIRILTPSLPKKSSKPEEPEVVYELSVLDLFDEIKVLVGQEKKLIERVEAYVTLIKRAQALGQTAQEEELVSKLVVHVYELIASVSGYSKYLDSTDLVRLQGACEKQLDIDYIKNFVRVIPEDVATKKLKADAIEVFDNYVVLYYDPEGKSFAKTEEEKKKEEAAKRDPVLFGVISGSDKLYYIADWIDELCDLTWDEVVEKLDGKIKEV